MVMQRRKRPAIDRPERIVQGRGCISLRIPIYGRVRTGGTQSVGLLRTRYLGLCDEAGVIREGDNSWESLLRFRSGVHLNNRLVNGRELPERRRSPGVSSISGGDYEDNSG